jgi:hypothetical protein
MIGADFIRITEKKINADSISLEKFQLYEISKNYEWTIFLDSDCLINPYSINFTELNNDIVVVPSYNNVEHHFFDETIDEKYKLDYYMPFFFLAFHNKNKNCVNHSFEFNKYEKFININSKNTEFLDYKMGNICPIKKSWFLDEFLLDLNIVKYGISTVSIREDFPDQNILAHSNDTLENKIKFLTDANEQIKNFEKLIKNPQQPIHY